MLLRPKNYHYLGLRVTRKGWLLGFSSLIARLERKEGERLDNVATVSPRPLRSDYCFVQRLVLFQEVSSFVSIAMHQATMKTGTMTLVLNRHVVSVAMRRLFATHTTAGATTETSANLSTAAAEAVAASHWNTTEKNDTFYVSYTVLLAQLGAASDARADLI